MTFKRIFVVFLSLWLMTATTTSYATISNLNTNIQYTSTGTTGPYAFTFPVTSGGIKVIVTDTAGEETLLSSSQYTVTYTSSNPLLGGSVTTTSAVTSGYTVTILRNTPKTQASVFTDGMPTLYKSLENGLDKLTMEVQDLQETVSRAPLLKATTDISSLVLPDPEASKYIGWNPTATGLENKDNPLPVSSTGISTLRYLSEFADFATALSTIGNSTATTLFIDTGASVTDDASSTSNIDVIVTKMGGFTIASGKTLTINGTITAGKFQVFAGTGTVTGNVLVSYPEWFGAVGDGTTDDTDAVQAANVLAPTELTEGKTYLVSTIDVTHNIYGKGVIKQATASSASNVLNVTAENITIKDISIQGSPGNGDPSFTGLAAIYDDGYDGLTVQGVTITDKQGGIISHDASDITAIDNKVYYSGLGIVVSGHIANDTLSSHAIISRNYVTLGDTVSTGTAVRSIRTNNMKDVIISGNRALGGQLDIECFQTAGADLSENINVINNIAARWISFSGVKTGIISGNTVDYNLLPANAPSMSGVGTPMGIEIIGSTDITASANTIRDIPGSGYYLGYPGGAYGTIADANISISGGVITDCGVTGNASHGSIVVGYADHVNIAGVTISGSLSQGIWIGGADATHHLTNVSVSNCIIKDGAYNGIYGYHVTNATITGNTISGHTSSGGTGIEISAGTAKFMNALVTGNNVWDNDRNYVQVSYSSIDLIGNRFKQYHTSNVTLTSGLTGIVNNNDGYIVGDAATIVGGTWELGTLWPTDHATNKGKRITVAGTGGTLSGVTGSITTGTTALVVNSAADLLLGQYITIAGVTGTKRITAISGTDITISSNADATVADAAVAFSAPTAATW